MQTRSLKASERPVCRRIQWFTCMVRGKGKRCSQNCKSFKVSATLCGFRYSSLLTYPLNHLPLFTFPLALFINSCTVNSPWPSSSHFSIRLLPHPHFCFITRLFRWRGLRTFIWGLLLPSHWKKHLLSVFGFVENGLELYYKLALWITVTDDESSNEDAIWSWW